MAFRDTNPQKLAYLLASGTHSDELKLFFAHSKNQLIMNGAKVQNIPHGKDDQIRTICERLPRKTDNVLRTWFHKNILVDDPSPIADVITYLQLHFDESEAIPQSDAKLVGRSALMYLFQDEPDGALLSFLQRASGSPVNQAIKSSTLGEADSAKALDHGSGEVIKNQASAPEMYQFSEVLASVIAGDSTAIDSALVPFPESTRAFVKTLLLIREGELEEAKAKLPQLCSDGPEVELVRNALSRARHQRTSASSPTGIRVLEPEPLADNLEAETYEIVGICVNTLEAGPVFVKPLCLVLRGALFQLEDDDRSRLFPESGNVMAYRSALRRPPRVKDLVRWKVSEREGSSGRTRFHMEADVSPFMEVLRIPIPSNDADELRDRVKELAASGRVLTGQQVVFRLLDGVAIASPKGSDIARDDAYEQPWQAWSSLDTWLIDRHEYCLDLSHAAASSLDISPLDAAFKKLLKNLEVDQKLMLSKTQKRDLAELLRSQSKGEVKHRADRIAASLDQISLDGEALEAILERLGSRVEVQRKVKEKVDEEVEVRLQEKAGLQEEIATLKRRKTDLEKEGRDIERFNKARADATAASVQDAFSRAIKNGAETLANAEIIKMLAGPLETNSRGARSLSAKDSIENWLIHGALAEADVKRRLKGLGFDGRQATILSSLSSLTAQSGVALVLKGREARQCVQTLIRQERELVGIIEVPMGLTSGKPFRQAFGEMSETQGIAVLDADLSPIEIYGAELLDSLFDIAIEDQLVRRSVMLSCRGDELSMPLSSEVKRLAVVIDLDSQWDQGKRSLEEVESGSVALLDSLLDRISENLSTLSDGAREHVEHTLVRAVTFGDE